jgi:hypothetical protein
MRELAIIRSYQDLQRALRRRADELNISNECLDSLCNFADAYASKLLAVHPKRYLGRMSLEAMLAVLGVVLVAYEDEEVLARMRPRLVPRKRNGLRRGQVLRVPAAGPQSIPVR